MTTTAPSPFTPASTVPGYLVGTWDIDTAHSEASFSIRHLMVSKVRGRFATFSGSFVTAENPLDSSVEATVELASIDTNNADRDAHIRSADFFDVEKYPTMTYRSTGVRAHGDDFVVDGELSLHGVTKPVSLQLEIHGFLPASPFGDTRVGFSAKGEIDREDFGISFNSALDSGGVALSHKVQIELEIEAIRRNDS